MKFQQQWAAEIIRMANLKKRLKVISPAFFLITSLSIAFSAWTAPLKASAPSTYKVQQGDTLWGLANLFLEKPWLWPELWRNNTQINNPHLIYPGDVLTINYIDGAPVLSVKRNKTKLVLRPQSDKRVKAAPIDVLPWAALSPYVNRHILVSDDTYDVLPKLLGNHHGNVRFVSDDFVLSQSQDSANDQYQVVRKQSTIRNLAGDVLGVQVTHVADARVMEDSELHSSSLIQLIDSSQEAKRGDKLLLTSVTSQDDLVLQQASYQRGFIVGDLHDHDLLGRYDVAILDLGSSDVSAGTVFGLYASGPDIINDDEPRYANEQGSANGIQLFAQRLKQPAFKVGEMIIIQTFESASYGIITRASEGIKRGFIVAKP